MKLKAVQPEVHFPALEERVLQSWDATGAFQRSIDERPESESYVFYDGPPFATGKPHYGHFVASVLKDIVPRYWAMKGKRVERRWGWDCHGLPVENETQKDLGLVSKADVDKLGIEKFNEACRGIVLRYTEEWKGTIRRLGRWVDHDRGYKTMDADFMESVWWVFSKLWQDGRIYEGYRVQPVSPALGTPLSNFEVALGPQERDPVTKKEGHKRRQDPSLTVRFALEDEEASLWAWTTTPWTLPSNLALAVNPGTEYVKVRVVETGEVAYLEPSRLADYQARGRVGETEELERLPGSALVGRPYRPLLPYFKEHAEPVNGKRPAFYVVAAEYVETTSGTGIVHQAPAFGEDDFQTGKDNDLPLVNPLSLTGHFDATVPDFEGQFAKDADKAIMAKLKDQGSVVDQDTFVHPYPHCYRTGVPLLYMAISTWFMKVEELRDQLVANNEQTHWVPQAVGTGRFGNWLAAARDWNLSRNRFWGTPLPIWRCDENPDEMVCVGSRKELAELCGMAESELVDLHRDKIDGLTFPSKSTPGGTMRRIPEVFDCWFESGSMPYAEHHYPFENKASVEANLPAEFIAEGLDQTRGWFYTLTVLSTALFGRPAFKNVIVNGMVLAEDGAKMSKSKQNFPDPNGVLERLGADALRIYLASSPVVNAKPLRFSEAGVQDHVRSVMLPLWNAYSFLTRYANVDGWEPDGVAPDPGVNELDGWVLSRLQTLLSEVEERMAAYELFRVIPALLGFIDDLTNWYIRRSRRRFWRGADDGDDGGDKLNAYRTLHHVLLEVSKALAPFLPFITEEMYGNLAAPLPGGARDSVHLEDYPVANAAFVDAGLEARMQLARTAVGLGRGLRAKHDVRTRQPLPSMTVVLADADSRAGMERMIDIVRDELNVKEVHVQADEGEFVTYSARPNLKLLGPKFGKEIGKIKAEALALASDDLARVVAGGSIPSASIDGLVYDSDSLLVDRASKEGTVVDTLDGVTVALDVTLTEELIVEGLARELVTRIQNLRKETGLELDDRIEVTASCDGPLADALVAHWELIAGEVLAKGACPDPSASVDASAVGASAFDIDGAEITLRVKKV
ncbi:Isoleucine--tRNA ligase [Planctomycetes bacterium Poly30]|uniref:Isoleucine--tRNA ligase n=1 Tax=Saltatorellus ferox TaxID=2528018 RepID=A0A518ERA4_9BACT|nr:Isoleucine--tRNA ligase [Planctomycetes bacterium Poly30]